MANHKVPVHLNDAIIQSRPSTSASLYGSVKQLDPVGDNWSITNNSKMQEHTFHITEERLKKLVSEEKKSKYGQNDQSYLATLVWDGDYLELAKYISEEFVDETNAVEGRMEEGSGMLDFVVYRLNVTFVEWENMNVWGLEVNGRGPVFADLSIDGAGDEGAVVVAARNGGGRSMNVILAEDRLGQLKNELVEYGIL
ncbi:Unknown protein [Striga hermonthica]|uniref:Uncharacterized protein n=1 Tax=Striga hermonthica TaxID=68872 RepID=A0A9N7MYN6_STRHE|nr:Unknown protein [Striga hermonthica]